MDQQQFVFVIKQFPLLWDRCHPHFRDKDAKENAWNAVGAKVGYSGDTCKETFKSIREKYIREREKFVQNDEQHREWELLADLTFLDPNIVPRKQSINAEEDIQKVEEFCSQLNLDSMLDAVNQTDFDRSLILLVKKTTPIWDRNCNAYPNKQLKSQLWQNIALKLNKGIHACMLRWKALREKYIRQKTKFEQEGDIKWDLLDDMSFLDKVIQYRKKQFENDFHQRRNTENSYNYCQSIPQRKNSDIHQDDSNYSAQNHFYYDVGDENSFNDSSNDLPTIIKQENTVFQVADSSYASNSKGVSRKRSMSFNSEASIEKRSKTEEVESKNKTPEQLFGDLVAAMLSKKPERERNMYMIEIMTVLSK